MTRKNHNEGQEWEWRKHFLSDVYLIGLDIKYKLSKCSVSFLKKMPALNRTVTLLELPSPHTDVPTGNSSTGGGSNCGK